MSEIQINDQTGPENESEDKYLDMDTLVQDREMYLLGSIISSSSKSQAVTSRGATKHQRQPPTLKPTTHRIQKRPNKKHPTNNHRYPPAQQDHISKTITDHSGTVLSCSVCYVGNDFISWRPCKHLVCQECFTRLNTLFQRTKLRNKCLACSTVVTTSPPLDSITLKRLARLDHEHSDSLRQMINEQSSLSQNSKNRLDQIYKSLITIQRQKKWAKIIIFGKSGTFLGLEQCAYPSIDNYMDDEEVKEALVEFKDDTSVHVLLSNLSVEQVARFPWEATHFIMLDRSLDDYDLIEQIDTIRLY